MKTLRSIVFFAGCIGCSGSQQSSPDAAAEIDAQWPTEVEFRLVPSESEFDIRVDGTSTSVLAVTLSAEEYAAAEFVVETYHPATGRLIDTDLVTPRCLEHIAYVSSEIQGVEITQTGQVTRGSFVCKGQDDLVADGFWPDVCQASWPCPSEQRCGLSWVHEEPDLFHLECTEIGSVPEGGACSFAAVGPGEFDDCAAGLVCVDAACRATCSLAADNCPDEQTCTDAAEVSWVGLGVCR